MTLDAPAKLNLYLAVQGRRADGFHELVTIMQTLELADEVTLELRPRRADAPADRPDVTLALAGAADGVPAGDDNLVCRAAAAWLAVTGRAARDGVDIALTKRIPPGGGLGGGSSDAAAVLRGLARLGGGPDDGALHALAATLGSDVPFFLVGGTALCTGRGERVTPLPAPRRFEVTLVLPGLVLPTPAVYAALDAPTLPADAAPLESPDTWAERVGGVDIATLEALYRNDLERPAMRVAPSLTALLARPGLHLSGSGSTLFCFGAPTAAVDAMRAERCIRFVPSMSRNR